MNKQFGHYEVQCELGRGGMGVVYKAWEPSLNRHVAIKVLGEHLLSDSAVRERFVREAKSMAALNSPHIIQIYFIGEEEGRPYFAMEYVEGQPLSELLKDNKVLHVEHAREILRQCCKGLGAAHDAGVIHRDIKPANIMMTLDGQVKIADFGIARTRELGDKLTNTGEFVGTPGYLSPEVCIGQEVDARADIFSLGIVFYEMLAGGMPFNNDSPLGLMLEVVKAEIPDIRQINKQVDGKTSRILQKMIAKSVTDRYQHCQEIIRDLGPAKSQLNLKTIENGRQAAPATTAKTRTSSTGDVPTAPALAALTGSHTQMIPATNKKHTKGWLTAATVFVIAGAAAAGYYSGYLPMPFKGASRPAVVLAGDNAQIPPASTNAHSLLSLPSETVNTPSEPDGDADYRTPDLEPAGEGELVDLPNKSGFRVAQLPARIDDNAPPQSAKNPPEPNETPGHTQPARPIDTGIPAHTQPLVAQVSPATVTAAISKTAATTSGHVPGTHQPAAMPLDKGVVVLAFGDPAVANAIEKIIESQLRAENVKVLNEAFIPGFSRLLEKGADLPTLRQAILKNGGQALVIANVNPTGTQELQYYGRSSTLNTAQLDVDGYDLRNGESLGGYGNTLSYTALNATEKATEAVMPFVDRLTASLKKATTQ